MESQRRLGELLVDAGDLAAAERCFNRVTAQSSRPPAPRDRLWALYGLGDIAVARGQLPAALARYRDGQSLAASEAKAAPGNAGWQRDLSVSYDRVADVLKAQGKLPEALAADRDSLAIAERLAKADPGNAGWQADLAASYGKLGQLHVKMGDKAEAMRLFQRGRAVVAPLAERSGHQLWIGYLKSFDADIAALGG